MSVIDRSNPFALHVPGPRMARRTPEGWVDQAYTRFTVTPVAPIIGARIDGFSLAEPLDEVGRPRSTGPCSSGRCCSSAARTSPRTSTWPSPPTGAPLETHPFIGLRDDQRPEAPQVVRLEKGPAARAATRTPGTAT